MYQICENCIMDTSDKEIHFNDQGICNHCIDSLNKIDNYFFSKDEENSNIEKLKSRVKKRAGNHKYDSIIGLSGGVDSSYIAYLCHINNLNPLCVHFDNGWNSDISIQNIKKIISVTGFDLHTEVINWPEFRDLQRSFILAGVVDIEMLSDHAIFTSLCRKINQYKIKTIMSGFNYKTEHGMPMSWVWSKMDFTNIKAIQKKFGSVKIKSFPHMTNIRWLLMKRFNLRGYFEDPLNLINYDKFEAIQTLKSYFNWESYGAKHNESIFTKFYQSYILPTKFGIDKRRVHLSCLIRTKNISRKDALEKIKEPFYDEIDLLKEKNFIMKKLNFKEDEFDNIIESEPVPHDYYPTDQRYIVPLIKLGKLIFGNKKYGN